MISAILELNLPFKDKNGEGKIATVKELFLMHPSIDAVERAAQSGEMGKYIIVYKEDREVAVNEFIDSTCEFVNNPEKPEEIKHHTYPKSEGKATQGGHSKVKNILR